MKQFDYYYLVDDIDKIKWIDKCNIEKDQKGIYSYEYSSVFHIESLCLYLNSIGIRAYATKHVLNRVGEEFVEIYSYGIGCSVCVDFICSDVTFSPSTKYQYILKERMYERMGISNESIIRDIEFVRYTEFVDKHSAFRYYDGIFRSVEIYGDYTGFVTTERTHYGILFFRTDSIIELALKGISDNEWFAEFRRAFYTPFRDDAIKYGIMPGIMRDIVTYSCICDSQEHRINEINKTILLIKTIKNKENGNKKRTSAKRIV